MLNLRLYDHVNFKMDSVRTLLAQVFIANIFLPISTVFLKLRGRESIVFSFVFSKLFLTFLEKKLDDFESLLDTEDIVINCSGLGAKQLGQSR